ncbi:hypothetical protein SELMODRAFT_425558 [Selaginella moellendorffii]|uniref:Uncharacterized protein n=1 Tax=Selaginella moellendorffii TaxID=88036 RepID=D8STH6_SELML|nr:hypothetical protein SELMODRAFT_425558 [Selaginella moellendorffii]
MEHPGLSQRGCGNAAWQMMASVIVRGTGGGIALQSSCAVNDIIAGRVATLESPEHKTFTSVAPATEDLVDVEGPVKGPALPAVGDGFPGCSFTAIKFHSNLHSSAQGLQPKVTILVGRFHGLEFVEGMLFRDEHFAYPYHDMDKQQLEALRGCRGKPFFGLERNWWTENMLWSMGDFWCKILPERVYDNQDFPAGSEQCRMIFEKLRGRPGFAPNDNDREELTREWAAETISVLAKDSWLPDQILAHKLVFLGQTAPCCGWDVFSSLVTRLGTAAVFERGDFERWQADVPGGRNCCRPALGNHAPEAGTPSSWLRTLEDGFSMSLWQLLATPDHERCACLQGSAG